jgi:hypothetical protein
MPMLFNDLHWWDVGESGKAGNLNLISRQAGRQAKAISVIIRVMKLEARFSENDKLVLLSSVRHRQSVCIQLA